MTKLKGILLTEGMHGMISQVEGLAKALDLEIIHEKIELNNFWKLIPPSLTPIKKFVFKNNLEKEFNIVISCGRKSVIPSIYLKKKYKKKIITVFTIKNKSDVDNYKSYYDVTDIYLFDSKGYEKSEGFNHNLIKNIKLNKEIMLAGNINIMIILKIMKKLLII